MEKVFELENHQLDSGKEPSDEVDNASDEVTYAKTNGSEPNSDVVDIYLAQAQAYCDEQQWEKAYLACREVLKIDLHSGNAYKMIGTLHQKQGKTTDAMGFYAKALSVQPHFPEVYSNLGSLYAKQKSWEKATEYYQKAIAQDSDFAIAYLNLSKVWKQLGNHEDAQGHLLQALKLNPSLGTAQEHRDIAQSLEAEDNKEGAIAFYRFSIQQALTADASKREEITLEANQRLADLLEEQGDWQAATECYHKVLDINAQKRQASPSISTPQPSFTEAQSVPQLAGLSKSDQRRLYKLIRASNQKKMLQPARNAKALLRSSSLMPAIAAAESAASPSAASPSAASPSTAPVLRQQSNQTRNWATVIGQLKQAIKKSPRSAALHRSLAKAFASNQQKRHSAAAWFRAFMLEPNWPSAAHYLELGRALEEQNNLKAAAQCYGHAVRLEPNSREAQLQISQMALRANVQALRPNAQRNAIAPAKKNYAEPAERQKPLQAQQSQRQQLNQRQRAEAANVAHNKGEALRKSGEWKTAIAAYKSAIRLNPAFSWSYHSLGDCYKALENWAAAASGYRRAISLNDGFVWSYYSLAEVLETQENWAAAAECYRRAKQLDPDNEQIPPRFAAALRALITISPRNTKFYQLLAAQLLSQGKTEEAISTYHMALQITPTDADLTLSLAKLLSDRDPKQAHVLLDRAIAINSEADPASARAGDKVPDAVENFASEAAVLKYTHLFDAVYYQASNPSVRAEANTNDPQELLTHYLTQGSIAGYNPNPLFDDRFYRTHHPELSQRNINPLVHYYQIGYKSGADPHPLFSSKFYIEFHKDVAATKINPLEHYLSNGAQEGRAAFSSHRLKELLETQTPKDASYNQLINDSKEITHTAQQNIGVYCSSLGNYFITEIADFIAAALAQAGHSVTRLNEENEVPDGIDAHWIIAPHEFFYLGSGSQWIKKQEWLARSVIVNVEQPQTTWFSKAFHFLRHAKAIFDINVKSAAILQALQLPAYWLPLGYLKDYVPFEAIHALPDLKALGSLPNNITHCLPELSAPLQKRPIDLHFIGTLNPRRERFFAKSAHWLSQYHSFLHIPPMGVPLLKGQDQALDTETVIGLSRRSKILLNIHRDELPYFEWHRIIFHGLWQNTLVVTEPCHDIPGLVADQHFIACDLDSIAEKVDWLLRSAEGQQVAERVRTAGHEAIKTQFDGAKIMANAAQIAQQALSSSTKTSFGAPSDLIFGTRASETRASRT